MNVVKGLSPVFTFSEIITQYSRKPVVPKNEPIYMDQISAVFPQKKRNRTKSSASLTHYLYLETQNLTLPIKKVTMRSTAWNDEENKILP